MSPLSRWLVTAMCMAMALWELVRGLFHLRPTLPVVIVCILFLIALLPAYRRDRRDMTKEPVIGGKHGEK